MKQIQMREIIAGVVAIGCIVLIALGIDGQVKALLGVIVGYYFGSQVEQRARIHRVKTGGESHESDHPDNHS